MMMILDIKQEVGDLKVGLIETGVDVGPAIYLARTFGTDIDTVVKFFIFILIFVFDPLAVMLVIAYNQALMDRQKNFRDVASINIESASVPTGFTAYSEPTGFQGLVEDDERMDIIGQNGNDGLHYEEEPNEPLEENDPTSIKKIDSTPSMRGGVKIQ